jgi:predicted enzyme related to lactoylglutathione lyase
MPRFDADSPRSIAMAVTEFFAGIPVADFPEALQWYERLWGKRPDFIPEEGEAVWQVTDHGWVYVVTDAERAGNALITILIDDLDEQIARLTERGIEVGPVKEMGPSVPGIVIVDAEGNRISFGQPPAAAGDAA